YCDKRNLVERPLLRHELAETPVPRSWPLPDPQACVSVTDSIHRSDGYNCHVTISRRVSKSVTRGAHRPTDSLARAHLSVRPALVGGTPTRYTAAVLAWQTLAEADAPDGQRLQLRRRGREFLIRAGGFDLMSSRDDASARALSTIGCAALVGRAGT